MRLLLALCLATLAIGGCDAETGCVDDFDCPAAQVCRVTSGACEAYVCNEDSECEGDQVCSDNRCEAPAS